MVQHGLPRCFFPGVTQHASCPHSQTRNIYTSSPANYYAEEEAHPPREAVSIGTSRGETGSRCPSDSQRRDTAPACGLMVTNWSSWADKVMQPGRALRQSPVMELSPAHHLEWNTGHCEIMTSKVVKQLIKTLWQQWKIFYFLWKVKKKIYFQYKHHL